MNGSRGAVVPRLAVMLSLLLWRCGAPVLANEAAAQPHARADTIKQDALQLGAKAIGLESRILVRSGPGTTIYLSAGNSRASITSMSIAVDGAPAISRRFDSDEMRALQQDGMYRLTRLGLKAGAHQVHAEVLLQYSGDAEPETLSLDDSWDIPMAASELVLALEGKNWVSSPALRLHQQLAGTDEAAGRWDIGRLWSVVNGPEVRDGTYRPESDGDPRIGNARFLVSTRDYFKAIVLRMHLSAQTRGLALSPDYYQVLTGALIDFGTLAWAQDTYLEVLGAGVNVAAAAAFRIGIQLESVSECCLHMTK